jgi:hypothetical protein
MVSSGMSHHVTLVRTDVSEELSASFIRVTRIGELGTTLAVTALSERPLRLNSTPTISTERVASVSVNLGSLLSAP